MNFLILVSLIISLDSGIHYSYLDPGDSRSLTREEYLERIRDRDTVLYEVLKARWFGEDVEDSKVPVEPYNMGIVGHWTFRHNDAVLMDGDIFYVVAGGGLFIYRVADSLIHPVTDSVLEKISELSVLVTHIGTDIIKYGDYLYIPFGKNLGIIDVSDPENPRLVGFYTDISDTDTVRFYYGVVVDDYLYISVIEGGRFNLHVLSLRYPEHPVKVGEYSSYYDVRYLDYDSVTGYLYGSDGIQFVFVFDISERRSPVVLGALYVGSIGGSNISGENGFIYTLVTVWHQGPDPHQDIFYAELRKIDARNPHSLRIIDRRWNSDFGYSVTVKGNYVYAAGEEEGYGHTINIYQIVDDSSTIPCAKLRTRTGPVHKISVSGNYMGIAGTAEARAYNVSNPCNPFYVGKIPCPGALGVAGVYRDYIYFTTSYSIYRYSTKRLWVIDVTDRAHPVSVNVIDIEKKPRDIEFWGNYMFLLYPDTGLCVYDISNPSEPVLVNTFYLDSLGSRMVLNYPAAYVGRTGGIYILDITDPENISLVSRDTVVRYGVNKVIGSKLFRFCIGLFYIYDVTDCFNPVYLGRWFDTLPGGTGFYTSGVSIGDNYILVGDDNSTSRDNVFDISDPSNIRFVNPINNFVARWVFDFRLPYIVVKTGDYSFAVVEVKDTMNFEVVASASTLFKLGRIVPDYPYIYVTGGYPGIVVYKTYLTGVEERNRTDRGVKFPSIVCGDGLLLEVPYAWNGNLIDVVVYDIMGRAVKRRSVFVNSNRAMLGLRGLNSGVYFVEIRYKGDIYRGKFVKFER